VRVLRTDDGGHGSHVITRDCPLDCLGTVLSLCAFNPLAHDLDRRFGRPPTVGDVADLHRQRQLGQIRQLGPRRISQIEAVLILAELPAEPS